jgi:hypothetical protein
MMGEVWQVKIDGKVYEADTNTLVEWAAGGYVQPTDKVKKGALEWTEAKNVPILRGPLHHFQMNPPQPQPPMSPEPAPWGQSGFASVYNMGVKEKNFIQELFSGMTLGAMVVAFIAAAVGLTGAILHSIEFIFLGFLIAFLIGLVGWLGQVIEAFKENILWALLVLFVPGGNIVFLVLRWGIVWRPFAIQVIGLCGTISVALFYQIWFVSPVAPN